MIACTLKFGEAHGAKFMSGRLAYDLSRGALLQLKKGENGEWHLYALSGDGRRIDTTTQSLLSFIELPPAELAAMRSDQRKP